MQTAIVIQEKLCTRCKTSKPLDQFGNDTRRSFGRRTWYKPCHAAGNARWRAENPETQKIATANWQSVNRAKATLRNRQFIAANPHKAAAYQKSYRERNPEKARATKIAQRARIKNNVMAQLNSRIGNQLRNCLRSNKRGRSTFELLKFSREELIKHIERQFTEGMDWPAFMRGEIHIDHIRPLAQFKFCCPEDDGFIQAWHLTNLRPLWDKQNMKKSAKRLFLI